MKKKKPKKLQIRKVLAIIFLIIIILFSRNIIYHFFAKEKVKQIRLLYNNEEIGLEDEIYLEDDVIYLSKEEIKKIFDDTIYYNKGDQELITTYNKHVAVLHLDEDKMILNDAEVKMNGTLEEKDGKIYLPLSEMKIVYDLEIEYAKENNIVCLDSINKEKSQALLIKNTKLKQSPNCFSRTIEKIKKRTNTCYN